MYLKIRAWDNDKKEMMEPVDLSISRKYWPEWFGNQDLPIMRSICHTDMHGEEVFEGDIIRFTYTENLRGAGKIEDYLIAYNECFFDFRAVALYENNTKRPLLNQATMSSYEVIGNIYENPELMEG